MNKERYIKQVLKKLNCSKEQKRKIKMDLNFDINSALTAGENLDEIVKRMGTPEELANEFNENMGTFSQRSRKKLIIGIIGGVVVGMICMMVVEILYLKSMAPKTSALGTSGLYQEEHVHQLSIEIVNLLSDHDYEGIYQSSSLEMQKAMDQNTLQKAYEDLGKIGTFQKVTSQNYAEVEQANEIIVVTEVVATYQERSVTYTISFDKDDQLVGLYMK